MFTMKSKRFFIFALFILAVTPFTLAMPSYSIAQDAPQDAATEITDIAIEGNKAVSTNTILSKIRPGQAQDLYRGL